ncbi:MAG: GIY-YIG nuclease family protein [Segniliparus sp.]|uniref:GIY-YIG nuclease family protein n=1 Tax=Segniliparus sp. TaxID=2804064 RepID=UPI003F2F6FC3
MSEGASAGRFPDQLRFKRYPIPEGASLSAVLPSLARAQLSGVYILTFADGMEYVGQTTKLLGRFSDHKRRWEKEAKLRPELSGDIVELKFSPLDLEKTELERIERQVIAKLEAQGAKLRNIAHVGLPSDSSRLEIVIEPETLQAWLRGERDTLDIGDRGELPRGRHEPTSKYRELSARPDYPEILAALASYVRNSLISPHQTEGVFWGVTSLPDTNKSKFHQRLTAISVNSVEAFVLYEDRLPPEVLAEEGLPVDEEWWATGGFFNLSPDTAIPEDLLEFADPDPKGYRTSGPVKRLEYSGSPADAADEFLSSPAVSAGSRKFAMGLLLKGRSIQAKYHDYNLADDIFALLQKQEDEKNGSAP